MALSRDTLMMSTNLNTFSLGELLDNYGAETLVKMIPSCYIFYYKYDKHINTRAKRNWGNGRPLHHINKTSGQLKKQYKQIVFRKQLLTEILSINCNFPNPYVLNAIIKIQRTFKHLHNCKVNYVITLQKYARRYFVKSAYIKAKIMIYEDIDFLTDSITTEDITDPCIILPDYAEGNFIIYNRSTLRNMQIDNKYPLYSYFDEITNSEEIVYRYITKRDIFNNILYKSPYTRREFTMEDVLNLKTNLIYKFGKNLQRLKLVSTSTV